MADLQAGIIVGSLRQGSFNRRLGKAIARLGEDLFESQFLEIGDLPLYNQDMEKDFPPEAQRLKDQIERMDGLLFITPEYNRSIPGVLKNAIDWASRPYGESAFSGKPAAICGTSPGAIGTACAQKDLRGMFGYLDMDVMGQPEVYLQFKDGLIDEEGNISNPDTEEFLQGFVDTFADWIG